jgi:hypothetical protein
LCEISSLYIKIIPLRLIRFLLYSLFFFLLFSYSIDTISQTETDTLSNKETDYFVPDTTKGALNNNKIPIFSMGADDSDAETESQDVSGLLQSSRDVFTSVAGFSFGQARFRIRGYGSENLTVSINGIRVNDLETGRAFWGNWAGLNDVTRYMNVQTGLVPSRENFSGIQGFTSIQARATGFRKGTNVSYAVTNRAYSHRFMFTHATGMMKNGWAFAVSASRRWAGEGYVEGTYFDATSYFFAAEKLINKRHTLSFIAFGAPLEQGRQAPAIQEAYDLAGSNFYNPNWGLQDGQKRNSRVSKNHKPMAMLTHYWNQSEKTKIQSSLFLSYGRGGITGINWFDARDPRPDFYRYLPSFHDERSELRDFTTNQWQNNLSTRQLDWDKFYFANGKNLYSVEDANGVTGNTVTGNRSKYILEELRNDELKTGGNIFINTRFSDKIFVSGGYNFNINKTYNYRQVVDLLGGDFWLDIDQFALRDFDDPQISQNNLDIPNRIVKEGDKYGYDYINNINNHELFGQAEYSSSKIDAFFSANISNTTFWRTSKVQNGRFPENSFGDSEKQNFFNYGVKGGITYKINGRNYISANGAYMTRAPFMRNSYVSPRTRHDLVNGLRSEEIISSDINYITRYTKLKTRLTLYYTEINNQTWMRSFYHDVYRNFVNYTMTGVDHVHYGMELGIDANITSTIVYNGVAAVGQSLWNSRPSSTISIDNSSELLDENRTVYLKNYRVGGMPQTAISNGLRYNSPKYWFAGFNVNYFADIYLDPNPDRRTAEAAERFVDKDPQFNELIVQTQLSNNITVDAYAGKSWRIKKYNSYINLNVSLSNILNNQDFAIGGFEQLRYDAGNIDRFPPKLSYLFGRTYFAMLSYRF